MPSLLGCSCAHLPIFSAYAYAPHALPLGMLLCSLAHLLSICIRAACPPSWDALVLTCPSSQHMHTPRMPSLLGCSCAHLPIFSAYAYAPRALPLGMLLCSNTFQSRYFSM